MPPVIGVIVHFYDGQESDMKLLAFGTGILLKNDSLCRQKEQTKKNALVIDGNKLYRSRRQK